MDSEYIRGIVFTAAGIGGALLLIWIGWRQRRLARGATRSVRDERRLRERALRGWPAEAARAAPVEALRRFATRASDSATHTREAADVASREGDHEIAGFLRDRAAESEDVAERALDLLRSRTPGEPRPSAP